MKRRIGDVAFLFAIIAAACAPLDERQLAERDYRRADREAVFHDFRARCRSKGKRIVIYADQRIGRDGVPGPGNVVFCR